MKRIKYVVIGITITISLVVALYFLLVSLGFSRHAYTVIALLLTLSGIYISIYVQKIQKPQCETCNNHLKLISKKKIGQAEEIRNGKFVFINTYDYEYHCSHCKTQVNITKSIKMK